MYAKNTPNWNLYYYQNQKQIKMDTTIQAAKRHAAINRIIGALKGGRHLSMKDGREFEVSEMHTCFCVIRHKIRDGKITGYIMNSRWLTDANAIRYKEYWFEDAQN